LKTKYLSLVPESRSTATDKLFAIDLQLAHHIGIKSFKVCLYIIAICTHATAGHDKSLFACISTNT